MPFLSRLHVDPANRFRLGELLVRRGQVAESDLQAVLAVQGRERRRLGDLLVDRGLVSRSTIRRILIEQWVLRAAAVMIGACVMLPGANIAKAAGNMGTTSTATARIVLHKTASFRAAQENPVTVPDWLDRRGEAASGLCVQRSDLPVYRLRAAAPATAAGQEARPLDGYRMVYAVNDQSAELAPDQDSETFAGSEGAGINCAESGAGALLVEPRDDAANSTDQSETPRLVTLTLVVE